MEARFKKSAKGMRWAPSSSSSSCFITNLPSPILMEILCRLPIKTLTACKCVCKSWLNLSRDPHFTQLHQARAPTEVCFQLYQDEDTIKLHMGNFHCLNNFDPRDVKINTLFEISKYSVSPQNTLDYVTVYFKFSNSCNGLLCYYDGRRNRFAVVWNPCTSEFITIPAPATSNCCRYGLGFSRKTNKYKLLRLVSQRIGESLGKNAVAEICTIEKGCSWNTLGPCPPYVSEVIDYCSLSYTDPAFLHGTLHWPSCRRNSDINMLTFDFEVDQFGRVPLPPSFGKSNSRLYRVGELSGCLFTTEYTNEGMNIWLMKEYGVQDSWTKMYSLPCIVNQNFFLPVTCMDNSEILLANVRFMSPRVFSYNPDQEGFRLIGSGRAQLRVIAYKPSLVPLKDSMLGYTVHVSTLKPREMSASPDWWDLHTEGGKRKGRVKATSESSVFSNVSVMMKDKMERIKTMREDVTGKKRKARCAHLQEFEKRVRNEFVKVVEPLKEEIVKLKQQNRQLDDRLQDEKAKLKQTKEQIQQSEQLKRQNQQLEERLKDEHAKVKQLEEKLQRSEQIKEES